MRKILAFAAAAVTALSMTACGKDLSGSPFAGKWYASGYEMWEIEMTSDELGETSVDLKTDGTAEMILMGESVNVKWDETDTGIEISGGGITIDGRMEEEYLVLSYSDVSIYMEKAE